METINDGYNNPIDSNALHVSDNSLHVSDNSLHVNDIRMMLIQSLQTIREMFYDRHVPIDLLTITNDELIKMYNNNTVFELKLNNTTKLMYYLVSKGVKNQDMKQFHIEEGIKKIVFISKDEFKTNNLKTLNKLKVNNIHLNIEYYYLLQLQFNCYRHIRVPKHIPLSKEEMQEVMKQYTITQVQEFPIILTTDPIIKYLDIKPDTLVKIIRRDTPTGEHTFYRYCLRK